MIFEILVGIGIGFFGRQLQLYADVLHLGIVRVTL